MWQIRTVAATDWPALAAFIRAVNRRDDGRHRCLHSEQGDSVLSHAQELRSLAAQEACFVAAREGPAVLGVAGATFDAGQGRAWVRGPLTLGGDATLPVALLQALIQAMPQARRFDAFPSADETDLRVHLRAAGFRDLAQHHVMNRPSGPAVPPWPGDVRDADDAQAAQAAQLHERLFPNTYLSASALCSGRDATHRLLVVEASAGGVAGYLVVQDKEREDEGYVDFLGVDPASRGRGVGRRLLDAAVHWSLAQRRRAGVSLTVRQDRAPAWGLYESAGFREVAAGAQMVFERSALTPP